jgi:hypothetical protein
MKPGFPVRRRILLLNIRSLQRVLQELERKSAQGLKPGSFLGVYGPAKSRALIQSIRAVTRENSVQKRKKAPQGLKAG